ncbi:MAG TPA: Sua5/YciO/YrdC/YwlC family protein, partial [bacterium]|nr:Sua5/YciO/YrdC/YwlC family protein [bacterium]
MEKVSIHLQNPQTKTLETIIAVLNEGGVVLLPGDTSYFLAIKMGKKNALEKLNRIKQTKKRKYYSVVFK